MAGKSRSGGGASHWAEVGGIIVLALFAFLCLALLSFDPHDPSFNRSVSASYRVRNLAGLAGSYTADLLIQSLGAGAVAIPFFTFLIGMGLLLGRALSPLRVRRVGIILIFLSSLTLLALLFREDPLFGARIKAGGLLGLSLSSLMKRYFNPAGAFLILGAVIVSSFFLALRLSPLLLLKKIKLLFSLSGVIFLKLLSLFFSLKKAPPAPAPGLESREGPLLSPLPLEVPKEPLLPEHRPERARTSPPRRAPSAYRLPSLDLLESPPKGDERAGEAELKERASLLEVKLGDYGVQGKVTAVRPGPVVTMYEFAPASGVKVSRIVNLSDDLALAMRALSVRIVAPVPGKAVVGIEIPNQRRKPVLLREILSSEAFAAAESKLTLGLGKDILGRPAVADLAQIPHLLIAGATGSGKSVGINAMISSLLFRATPKEVKFLMIDPKMLELSAWDGIPHLLVPVVTNPKQAAKGLRGVVAEMERRHRLLTEKGVRNLEGYNSLLAMEMGPERTRAELSRIGSGGGEERFLPFIVVVIDELADLMLVSSREVEDALTRLAQMGRASGIHLLVATQRPSVDVLTGLIKANFPARISFQVSSRTDSRTILDANGAERLLGKGDMLFLRAGTSRLERIHGAFVSERELKGLAEFWRKQDVPVYDESLFVAPSSGEEEDFEDGADEKYSEAIELVARTGEVSISMLQRRLRVGYNRAARMIERMEREGIVGPSDGVKRREVFLREIPRDH